MSERFLQDRIELLCGDCREQIARLADASIDACVTDPPYSLVSIIKRFGNEGSAPAQFGSDGRYARASAGFMNQKWDTGEVAFDPEFWREVLRVLKPGAHLIAFGGTRTYHRMACAIEDAGFEIRDQIGWAYGSGFPKSHDVSKGIDKRGGVNVNWFGPWLKEWRAKNGIAQKDISALFPSRTGGKTGCVANWELGLGLPTVEQFNLICSTFGLPFESMEEAERDVVGTQTQGRLAVAPGQDNDRSAIDLDITAPATDAARQWFGWGTALKPAWEPCVLARKPLSEKTVAANVLEHGTGAINIDGCRVGTDGEERKPVTGFANKNLLKRNAQANDRPWMLAADPEASGAVQPNALGRWPANILLDGSEEVVAAFPDSGNGNGTPTIKTRERNKGWCNSSPGEGVAAVDNFGDSGSAARFFYQAKQNDLRCQLCDVNNADQNLLTESTQIDASALFDVPASPQRESAGKKNQSNDHVNNAEIFSTLCHQQTGASAALNADHWPLGKIVQNVLAAANLCGSCATAIAREIVAVRHNERMDRSHLPASIEEFKKTILLHSLASYVAHRENTDTILTTTSLRELFGCVFYAIGESINSARVGSEANTKPEPKRLWYSAKADSDDRIGSKHPTVKPVDLMQYLVRLITPKGGTVLDPFAGTGTTGEAAFREGFRAVLIEREEEYQADIRRRMALVMAGPDERSRESMKEKQKGKPIDYGPLFGGTDELPEAVE